MARLYAISDPHGCLDVLDNALRAVNLAGENHLYLLGDCLPHQTLRMGDDEYLRRSCEALSYIRDFHLNHKQHVTVLMGNHEFDFADRCLYQEIDVNPRFTRFIRSMPLYAETAKQIFAHAGINEVDDNWKVSTSDIQFLTGGIRLFKAFEKDIVTGHRSARELANDADFDHVFWDGVNHYVIDGQTEDSGVIPMLIYDTDDGTYYEQIVTSNATGDMTRVAPNKASAS